MSNYIPWYGKKRATLARRGRELTKLLRGNASEIKVAEAAEKVRAAAVRALHAERARRAPCEKSREKCEQLNAEIDRWLTRSNEEIVDTYRRRRPR